MTPWAWLRAMRCCAMARRLSALLEQGQTLARVDGDTFALLLTNLRAPWKQPPRRRRAQRRAADCGRWQPVEVSDQVLHLSVSAEPE